AADLLDRPLELRVVERRDVERPHLVAVREQAPREMEAEEPGAAGDRDEHRARLRDVANGDAQAASALASRSSAGPSTTARKALTTSGSNCRCRVRARPPPRPP